MFELAIVVLFLYLLTVGISLAMIKLIWDDLPMKYAFIPLFNVLIPPFLEIPRAHTLRNSDRGMTPQREVDRQRARNSASKLPH